MGWCFESEADTYTDAALHALRGDDAIVPSLWLLEVTNVLLHAERRRRIGKAEIARFLGLVAALPIVIAEPMDIRQVGDLMALARRHGLTAYDAAYLHLAVERRAPLATRDKALRAAASAAGVPAFRP